VNIEYHNVGLDGDKVTCSFGDLSLDCKVWGRGTARTVAWAHAARPRATVEMLLEFAGVGE